MSGCGFAMYGRIVIGLRYRPETSAQLATRYGFHLLTMRRVLRALTDLGVLHVHGTSKADPSAPGSPERIYKEGAVGDRPVSRVRPPPMLIAFATLWRALQQPRSVSDLANVTGLNKRAIYRFLADATTPGQKYVRIVDWRSAGGGMPLYRLGPQADVPKPARQSNSVTSSRCRRARRMRERQQQAAVARLQQLAANASIFRIAASAA